MIFWQSSIFWQTGAECSNRSSFLLQLLRLRRPQHLRDGSEKWVMLMKKMRMIDEAPDIYSNPSPRPSWIWWYGNICGCDGDGDMMGQSNSQVMAFAAQSFVLASQFSRFPSPVQSTKSNISVSRVAAVINRSWSRIGQTNYQNNSHIMSNCRWFSFSFICLDLETCLQSLNKD